MRPDCYKVGCTGSVKTGCRVCVRNSVIFSFNLIQKNSAIYVMICMYMRV
jgi:hypothetical protein